MTSDMIYKMLKNDPDFKNLSMDKQGEICLDVMKFIQERLTPAEERSAGLDIEGVLRHL